MVSKQHSLVAKEAMTLVMVFVAGSAILLWVQAWWQGFVLLFIAATLAYLNRDPVRKIPAEPLAIIAPVDGVVLEAGADYDPVLKRDCLAVSIRMGFSGVYSVRNPMEGKVKKQWYFPLEGVTDQAGYANWVQSDEGDDLVWTLTQRGGRILACAVQPGERVGQGQRCGFVPWGRAELTIYVAKSSRLLVKNGDTITAGSDCLAQLVHKQVPANMNAESQNRN